MSSFQPLSVELLLKWMTLLANLRFSTRLSNARLRLYAPSQVEFSNLYFIVLMEVKAGQASMTKQDYLLGIAKTHNIPYEP